MQYFPHTPSVVFSVMSGRNNESSLEIEAGNVDWDIEIYFNKTFGEKILKGKPN